MFENVKALTSDKFKYLFEKWCKELESYGYANFYQVLNAKNYGVPQSRERIFMISILRTDDEPDPYVQTNMEEPDAAVDTFDDPMIVEV